MKRFFAWLGAAALVFVPIQEARADEPLKPFILFVLDTSGSMNAATGFGPPSCPQATDTRLQHAKCAIQNIANSYGDMVMALGRFRQTRNNDNCNNGCVTGVVCNPDPAVSHLEVLVPLLEDQQPELVKWNSFTCNGCGTNAADPELFAPGNQTTPIAGSLRGAKSYWQGTDPDWTVPNEKPGGKPILRDPKNNIFTSPGRQCRPYITIMLTDGGEACEGAAAPPVAATALLTTQVNINGTNRTYRIETKPIGFGINPGDPNIEALAHAGGNVGDGDGPAREGAYARNEEELQIEISQIIADALKFEKCNGADDDCDTRIDEDFPDKGQACDDGKIGKCKGTGSIICNAAGTGTECKITTQGANPKPEICNNEDDDCDTKIDENEGGTGTVCPQPCVPGTELCNGVSDDCDPRIDEGIPPLPGCAPEDNVCGGQRVCRNGAFVCEGGTPITPEVCNGLDDDCDGVKDGLIRACPPNAPPPVGECHGGIQVCPAGGNGQFGDCLGQVTPKDEACDGKDNDCDGTTDEDTGGGDCTPDRCGVGTIVCKNGKLECEVISSGRDEVCNGFDDDCDVDVDEDIAPLPGCPGENVCGGQRECIGGRFQCRGGTPNLPEVCDCKTNDCDDKVDEDVACGGSARCVGCSCKSPCGSGEFPCSGGQRCVTFPEGRFCADDPCHLKRCPMGESCRIVKVEDKEVGQCVPKCEGVTCIAGQRCLPASGTCVKDDCVNFPDKCGPGERCLTSERVCGTDKCSGVSCPEGQYCLEGECKGTCAGVTCPDGERCRLGACEPDPCGAPCPANQVCNESMKQCQTCRSCPSGQVCDSNGTGCKVDPCDGVVCPATNQVCRDGSCFLKENPTPDAPLEEKELVTPGGGGGCSAGGTQAGAGLLAALVLLLARRRRARGEGVVS